MSQQLVWQQQIWQKLMHNRAFRGHALLLKGKKGIGKFTFARLMAKSLLCLNPGAGNTACENCASCSWFEQRTHPDFRVLLPEALSEALNVQTSSVDHSLHETGDQQAAANKTAKKPGQQIGIDQIRKLNELVYLSGHQHGYKIVLIYPAETMNTAAASALLKKLEEPPENTLFILVSHQPQRLLPTIRSRCQQIAMPVPDTATASQWLEQQLQQTGCSEPKDGLMLLALSGFSPLSALSFQDKILQHRKFIEEISTPQRFDPLTMAEMVQNQDLAVTVDWLQKWCYDLVCFHAAGKVRYHAHLETRIQRICGQLNRQACMAYLRFLNTRQPLSRHPVNARLFLEEIFIHYGKLLTASSTFPVFAD
ncbi:MAG: DNA polymerase III subunit delta' [Burkholderiales bacterium]|nr:DNA polymerase III subunit delta' [Burkholderiales bacterium]MDR4516118.1 DNA polymerase III subunit delta' [Nitrosomonas sp.]